LKKVAKTVNQVAKKMYVTPCGWSGRRSSAAQWCTFPLWEPPPSWRCALQRAGKPSPTSPSGRNQTPSSPAQPQRCPTGTRLLNAGSSDTFQTPASLRQAATPLCSRGGNTFALRADCAPPGSASSTRTPCKRRCSRGCWPVHRSSTRPARPCGRPSARTGTTTLHATRSAAACGLPWRA
jgi:hypothetical protein